MFCFSRYETNIIVALKGPPRINEYRGKHKLDVCIVYAAEPRILLSLVGESNHFKIIPKVMNVFSTHEVIMTVINFSNLIDVL